MQGMYLRSRPMVPAKGRFLRIRRGAHIVPNGNRPSGRFAHDPSRPAIDAI